MLDEDQLNARFASTIDLDRYQVLVANGPSRQVDENRIYCRWTIEPGASEKRSSDGTRRQLGIATLQIIAPPGSYTREAIALRDQFLTVFQDWRSDDRCLRVYKAGSDTPAAKDYYQINARVYWESGRRPAGAPQPALVVTNSGKLDFSHADNSGLLAMF